MGVGGGEVGEYHCAVESAVGRVRVRSRIKGVTGSVKHFERQEARVQKRVVLDVGRGDRQGAAFMIAIRRGERWWRCRGGEAARGEWSVIGSVVPAHGGWMSVEEGRRGDGPVTIDAGRAGGGEVEWQAQCEAGPGVFGGEEMEAGRAEGDEGWG
jgi:hypothetical protein